MSLLQIKSIPLLHSSLRGSQTAFTPNAGVLVVAIDSDAVLVSILVEEEDVGVVDVEDGGEDVVGDFVVNVADVTVSVKVVPVPVVVVEVAEVVDVEVHPPANEACDSSLHDSHSWSAVKVAGTAMYSP